MSHKLAMLSLAVVLATGVAVGQGPAGPGGGTQSTEEKLAIAERCLQLAQMARNMNRPADAAQLLAEGQRILAEVISADQRNLYALGLGGDIAMEQSDPNTARQLYKAALEIDPANFRANLGLGQYYVSSRWWRQAQACLEQALAVAPAERQSEVLRLLAVCHSGMKDKAKAIEYAERARQANPEDPDGLQLLVAICLEQKLIERAVEASNQLVVAAARQRAAKLADPSALDQLIRALDTQTAALRQYHNTLYRRDAQDRPTDQLLPGREAQAAQVLGTLAHIGEEISKLRWERNYHDMRSLMMRAVEYQPNNLSYLADLAGLYAVTNQPEQAIATYQRLLAVTEPSDADQAVIEKLRQAAREELEKANAPLQAPTTQPAAPAGAATTAPATTTAPAPAP